MLDLIIFVLLAVVVPVVVNKTTESGHFQWIKPRLRLIWTAILMLFTVYFFQKQASLEIAMDLHKRWSSLPWLGYVLAGTLGAFILCGYWWLTGKMLSTPEPLQKQKAVQPAAEDKPPTLLDLFNKDLPNVMKVTDEAVGIQWKDGTILEGVSLVVGGERRLNSFYATCFFKEV